MITQSKHYENQSSAAKRTSTQLKALADQCLDAESKGILLAASRVTSQIARERKTMAGTHKAKEVAYEKAMRTMMPEAEAKIRAEWPINTTLEKVALIVLNGLGHRLDSILVPPSYSRSTTAQEFEQTVEESIKEIASSIAYRAHKDSKTVSEAICEYAIRFENATKSPYPLIKNYAGLIDAAIESQKARAA